MMSDFDGSVITDDVALIVVVAIHSSIAILYSIILRLFMIDIMMHVSVELLCVVV